MNCARSNAGDFSYVHGETNQFESEISAIFEATELDENCPQHRALTGPVSQGFDEDAARSVAGLYSGFFFPWRTVAQKKNKTEGVLIWS